MNVTKPIHKIKSKPSKNHSILFKSQRATLASLISLSQDSETLKSTLPSYFKSSGKKKLRALPIDKVDEFVVGITSPQCKSCKPVIERMRCIGLDQEREIFLTLTGKYESLLKNLFDRMDFCRGDQSLSSEQNQENGEEKKFSQNNEDVFHSVSEIMNESKEETPNDLNELSLNELCKDDDKNMDFWVFGQTSPQYY